MQRKASKKNKSAREKDREFQKLNPLPTVPPKIIGTSDVPVRELPDDFANIDHPFGIPLHIFNRCIGGMLTHTCLAYYLLYLWPLGYVPRASIVFGGIYGYVAGLGITIGSHRFFTHKMFKANLPLQIILMLLQTMGLQHTIFQWCRDHRVHHKYVDTAADPHNAKRGFWFCHITWLFLPRTPELIEAYKTIYVDDLVADPVVRFQAKYYWWLVLVTFFITPMAMLCYLFPEMSWFHIFVTNFARHGVTLHITFLVNSVAHMWGDKPYDQHMTPTQNKWVSLIAIGEGWHNYHHTFPWDYRSSEFGSNFEFSLFFIHFFAKIGWAWDLKTVSQKLLIARINRTGDGSHPLHKDNASYLAAKKKEEEEKLATKPVYWGWGDKEIMRDDLEITEIKFQAKNSRA